MMLHGEISGLISYTRSEWILGVLISIRYGYIGRDGIDAEALNRRMKVRE